MKRKREKDENNEKEQKKDDESINNNQFEKTKKQKITNHPQRTTNLSIYDFYQQLRLVKPYYFTYKTNTKKRWVGQTILNLYLNEFNTLEYPKSYWINEIIQGKIQVDGKNVNEGFKLLEKHKVSHEVHRHEFPVMNCGIEFIDVTKDYYVVNKPASIPVHPCGKYFYNSLTKIMQYEYGIDEKEMFPIHRIDRLTSGVLVIGRSKEVAQKKFKQITNFETTKVYIAKSKGKYEKYKTIIKVEKNMRCFCKRRGIWGIDDEGKYNSLSYVYPICYSPELDESLVMVNIVTGRTHQVRIHLKYLNHPIPNDPLYGEIVQLDKRVFDHDYKNLNYDENCYDCKKNATLFDVEDLVLFLHSWKYVSDDINYTAPLPTWVNDFKINETLLENDFQYLIKEVKARQDDEKSSDEEMDGIKVD